MWIYKCRALGPTSNFISLSLSAVYGLAMPFGEFPCKIITLLIAMRFVAFWTERYFDPTYGDGSNL